MPQLRFNLIIILAGLVVSSCPLAAADTTPSQANQSTAIGTEKPVAPVDDTILTAPGTTSIVPAPVLTESTDQGTDNKKRHFVITSALRVGYDDNIFTSKDNKVGSFTTSVTPSLLIDFPTEDGDFSARYTFDAIYYENRPGNKIDVSHQFVARYNHSFSERFAVDVREQFLYYTEPSLFQGTGTQYRDGAYIDNTATVAFSAQWTPLLGSTTNYSNTLIDYQDSNVALEQNNMENTVSHDFSFAILPKINLLVGGIFDNVDYDTAPRDYTSYTGSVGVSWQALPSITTSARVGGTVTDAESSGTTTSPYAAVDLNWRLGSRSYLTFDYSHSIVPTDVVYANGQEADRFTSTFAYDVTRSITVRLQGIYTYSNYTSGLILPGTLTTFSENSAAVALGAAYHLSNHFDLDANYTFSDVSSDLNFRDYTRNQFSFGIRGTY